MSKPLPKIITNLITQHGMRLANKHKCKVTELGIEPEQLAFIANLIQQDVLTMQKAGKAMDILAKNAKQINSRPYYDIKAFRVKEY